MRVSKQVRATIDGLYISAAAQSLSCAAVLASLLAGEVRYQTIQRLPHLG